MCISAIIAAGIGAAGAAYSASEQRKTAKEQSAQMAEQARRAAVEAQENARANAIAAEAAAERERVTALAKQNAELAVDTAVPEVEVGPAAAPEVQRRRTVRATFDIAGDDNAGGSIRL